MEKWLLLKQARSIMKLTQAEMGKLMSVDLQEVSKWERDVVKLPDSRIHQLKDYYEDATGDKELFSDIIKKIMSEEYRLKNKKVRR